MGVQSSRTYDSAFKGGHDMATESYGNPKLKHKYSEKEDWNETLLMMESHIRDLSSSHHLDVVSRLEKALENGNLSREMKELESGIFDEKSSNETSLCGSFKSKANTVKASKNVSETESTLLKRKETTKTASESETESTLLKKKESTVTDDASKTLPQFSKEDEATGILPASLTNFGTLNIVVTESDACTLWNGDNAVLNNFGNLNIRADTCTMLKGDVVNLMNYKNINIKSNFTCTMLKGDDVNLTNFGALNINATEAVINDACDTPSTSLLSETKKGQTLPRESLPMLSPKNCFKWAIRALQGSDGFLQMLIRNYFEDNLEILQSSEPFKLLKMADLKALFAVCYLPDDTKLLLLEAKLAQTTEELEMDHGFIVTAASLSSKCRKKYPILTSQCYMFLKHSLSGSNCIDTAIFAQQTNLDELKVWAEHHVIVNFNSIISDIRDTKYSEDVIKKFCKISCIPTKMCKLMLEACNEGSHKKILDQSILQVNPSNWLKLQLRKLSSTKTTTIGTQGGVIELDECSVTFPEGALSEETAVTMAINTDPDNFPDTGRAITPILSIEPSMTFKKPVAVRMHSCMRAVAGHTIIARLLTNDGSGWHRETDINLHDTYEINFSVDRFSGKNVTVDENATGVLAFYNSIFIHRGTGEITSCFYRHPTDGKNIRREMRWGSCASFCRRPLKIEGKKDQAVKLRINLEQPVLTLNNDDWDPITIKEIDEKENDSSSTLPGRKGPFMPESLIYGVYYVSVDSVEKSTSVSREWPVTLDPEIPEPASYAIGKYVTEGGTIHEHNKDTKTIIG